MRKNVGNFDKKRFSSTSGRMDTQHKGISLYLILPSDHTTFTRGHSDESTPFAKLWFLKRNPLTFLPRSSNEIITSEYVGYKALYIETEIKNISFVGFPNCINVPSKHVLLKSYEFFHHNYVHKVDSTNSISNYAENGRQNHAAKILSQCSTSVRCTEFSSVEIHAEKLSTNFANFQPA